jgi:Arm DNA-binding domain
MTMHLSAKSVAAMVLGDKRDVIFFDDVLIGFGFRLRESKSGKILRSWIVQHRDAANRSHRVTLGRAEVLDAAQARAAARLVLARVALDRVDRRYRLRLGVTQESREHS